MNKTADFIEKVDTIKKKCIDMFGKDESKFVLTLHDSLRENANILEESKSAVWDELFKCKRERSLNMHSIKSAFEEVLQCPMYIKICILKQEENHWKDIRERYKLLCVELSDLLVDYSQFHTRNGRCSLIDSAIYIPGVVNVSNVSLYDDSTGSSIVPLIETITKLEDLLYETLENMHTRIIQLKSNSFDIVLDSYFADKQT